MFAAWCGTVGVDPLPATPASVGAYLTALADRGLAVATLARRRAAIVLSLGYICSAAAVPAAAVA